MKIEYFNECEDALSIFWGKKGSVAHSRELKKVNVTVDFDDRNNIIGIEVEPFEEALRKSQREVERIFKKAEKKK